jgi:AraC-like DNA-binding protein
MTASSRANVSRGELAGVRWELATRPPLRALAPYVQALQGYVEQSEAPVQRCEFSGVSVVVILEFGPRLRVYANGSSTWHDSFRGGFVGGMDDSFTRTEHAGSQSGLQLNLHPLGARLVFGLPLHELRGRALAFEDLLPEQRGLSEQLAELASWDARFDRIERLLCERLQAAGAHDPIIGHALRRLAADGGGSVADLAGELGYSQKHVIARFHDQVGVPPKVYSRLLRFERLRRELTRPGPARSWAELAQTCGYYDQAHLARDVRQFTGTTPSALLGPAAFRESA